MRTVQQGAPEMPDIGTLEHYFPGPGEAWERADPAAAGMDPAKLDAATAFAAKDAETIWPMDLQAGLNSAQNQHEPLPSGEVLGPATPTGQRNRQVTARRSHTPPN